MVEISPIGVIRSPREALEHTPVQAAANLDEEATVVFDDAFHDGLEGLDGFSHAWLLTWLGGDAHDPQSVELRQRPFLRPDGPPLGIFAMRGPRRPTPIGLSLVEVVSVANGAMRFRGVDTIDGTLVLDVKPYFADADSPRPPVRCGWFDEITLTPGATPSSLRPRSVEDPQD